MCKTLFVAKKGVMIADWYGNDNDNPLTAYLAV
jgi:hypothetical protein